MMLNLFVVCLAAFSIVAADPDDDKLKRKKNEPLNALDVIFAVNKVNADDDTYSNDIKTELFEGDIMMTKKLKQQIGELEARGEDGGLDAIRNGVWPDGVVPYTFARNFAYGSVVRRAFAEYKKHVPCIKFEPYNRARHLKARGYIEFMHGGGCYSMIGRQARGKQQVSLGRGCNQIGVAIHEIMHALGFFHEQSRRDRDGHVRIVWNNINRAMQYNFKKYQPGEADTLGFPYDKQSVMHYGNYAFSTNRRKTIVSIKNPNEVLGQRRGLSAIDIKQLNKYYKCKGTTTPTKRPTTSSKCQDNYKFCVSLDDWCTHSFVKVNCKKTCKRCSNANCKDERQSCKYWASLKYCVQGKYVGFMMDKCKKTCGKC